MATKPYEPGKAEPVFIATCFSCIFDTLPADPDCWINDPVRIREPDTWISYASAEVKACTDCETWDASIVCPVAIPLIVNLFAMVKVIFYYKYYKIIVYLYLLI